VAKEKIRKLLRERILLNNRVDNLAAMLAFLTDKNGGELTFTEQDIRSIPEASFQINVKEGVYTLKLQYPETENPLDKHKEAAAQMEKELLAAV
jgi:hypothetical protein